MKKTKNKRFLFIILLIILLPLIILELIIKGIFRLLKKIFKKNKKFTDQEFYESLSIEKVDIMDGVEFEQFLKRLFVYQGYSVSDTPRTGDFGADLILKKDGRTTVLQAKRYAGNVGAKALQEIYSARAHYNADYMMVVTTANFTKQAEVMATEQSIELVDRAELIQMIAEVKDIIKEEFGRPIGEINGGSASEFGYDNFKYRI